MQPDLPMHTVRIWEAVKNNDVQTAYRLLVALDANPNTLYDEVHNDDHHTVDEQQSNSGFPDRKQFDPANCEKILGSGEPGDCLQGCSLLHLACHMGDPVMLELLLQFGADINLQDFHGRTPLHHCVLKRNDALAKYLIRR